MAIGDCTWTTTAAPGRELAYWREAVCDAVIELEIDADPELPFSARLSQTRFGPVSYSKIRVGTSQSLVRSRSTIARSRRDQFELVYFNRLQGQLSHAGREVELRSNHCVLIDGNRPYSLQMNGPSRNISVHIPTKWLAARFPNVDQALARPVDCNNPIGAALTSLIGGMARKQGGSSEFDSLWADQIVGVFFLALGPLGLCGSQHTNKLYERVRQALRDLSHDQELSATVLAEELGISVRYLHYLFAQAGTSYGRELQATRLEAAIRMLGEPRFRGISINEIAFRAGYSEPSHFCRRFKEAKGITPASYRAAALN